MRHSGRLETVRCMVVAEDAGGSEAEALRQTFILLELGFDSASDRGVLTMQGAQTDLHY